MNREQGKNGTVIQSIPKWIFGPLLVAVLLVLVLSLGGYLRAAGLSWGEYQYLHPDERFLVWVGSDITPIKSIDPVSGEKVWISLSEYFGTANSPLNPNNRGHGFYVYGTLPMFLARYAVEFLYGHSGFDPMTDVGRALSAAADLTIVLLVFLVAARLYNKKVGLLAAAFSAVVVLQIQQSHFFTMDNFVNLFSFLAFYIAIRIQTDRRSWYLPSSTAQDSLETDRSSLDLNHSEDSAGGEKPIGFLRHPLLLPSIAFGIAFGMAMASKLNAAPVALLLPAAVLLRLSAVNKKDRYAYLVDSLKYLVIAAGVSFLTFRILQPYAFSGPGFFGISLNPSWIAQVREQRGQASIFVDFPPAMQWARRTIFFSAKNLTIWGLGLPLGILSWIGFGWVGLQVLKGKWRTHLLIWGWTAAYFIWQSLGINPTMRYQLPIYPTLVIFAAWAVVELYRTGREKSRTAGNPSSGRGIRILAVFTGGVVLLLSMTYAFGFTGIYNRQITRLEASRWIYQNIPGPINLRLDTGDQIYNQPVAFPYQHTITPEVAYTNYFTPKVDGILTEIYLPHVKDLSGVDEQIALRIHISEQVGDQRTLLDETIRSTFFAEHSQRGGGYALTPDSPISLEKNTPYTIELSLETGNGALTLQGATLANEGEWDDAIPYRVEGYDPFGGIYPPDVNFNMYWEETPEKLDRFLRILDQSDFIAITSSRQWGSLPRIPERFPLSTVYYRELIGCPEEREIEWCYNVAEPGMFSGRLGFDLVETFQSDPSIGPLQINDQFSEEAFTVYDHPKVFIFEKQPDYDARLVSQILGSVDFTRIVRLPPLQYESHPADLTLPVTRLLEQISGGTWSQIFDSDGPLNRYPVLGVIAWYLGLAALGLIVYPLVRVALPGLDDRGYPLSRAIGLLLLSYLVWLAGSIRIPFHRSTISVVLGILLVIGGILAYRQREQLLNEWRSRRRYFLIIEGILLIFFVVDLLIRYGNPDLWHPWKGGEKPMDFAYLNAVLKSSTFPPFDPWYSGGYLNYYYYGFMLVGVLVKWLGIVPSIAYNLVVPTIFSLIAIGAFSVVWNLTRGSRPALDDRTTPVVQQSEIKHLPYITGIAGALGMAVLGNLGTVKMIVIGFQNLAAPGGMLEGAGFLTRLIWTFQGFIQSLGGASLPYGVGDWYWLPSRIIPASGEIEPITEFPFFTVLYADPHAHLFALPVALLAVSFALSIILARGRWQNLLAGIAGFTLGGLVVGALRPTNTWDFYTYLAVGGIAIGYALIAYYRPDQASWNKLGLVAGLNHRWKKIIVAAGGILIFVAAAFFLYQPYAQWYALGYTAVDIWQGTRTPLHAYFLHWGLFLFLIVSWMTWETIDWMASTPVSALQKFKPYREVAWLLVLVLLLVTAALGIKLPGTEGLVLGNGVNVAWVVIPLGAWSAVLLLRPGITDAKKFVLFLVGSGLVLTLMVEVIVLRGDIGRMNTVFKFYLQVWTIFAVSGAAALGWVLTALPRWSGSWRSVWQVVFVMLITGTALYPLVASRAKIEDRIAPDAPKSLDGMEFMKSASYLETWGIMDLGQDYDAIRWLQENVAGSPVIVEANLRNLYRWGSRMSIYTGLPGVVGWEWHQQQQRAILPGSWVTERIFEVDNFYQTTDVSAAYDFLNKYDVRYIIVGQQERGHYPGEGLEKFTEQEGILWQERYRSGETVIYEVIGDQAQDTRSGG